jgi:nucleolin
MGKKQKSEVTKQHLELFISGLPYSCTEDDLKSFLSSDSITEVKLPKFQDSGRCLGYAHVIFDDE